MHWRGEYVTLRKFTCFLTITILISGSHEILNIVLIIKCFYVCEWQWYSILPVTPFPQDMTNVKYSHTGWAHVGRGICKIRIVWTLCHSIHGLFFTRYGLKMTWSKPYQHGWVILVVCRYSQQLRKRSINCFRMPLVVNNVKFDMWYWCIATMKGC